LNVLADDDGWRGPPPEAYSRVTNSERFRPLHAHALGRLADLQATYDVAASEGFELLPGIMQPFEHARPPVTLRPGAPGAAPVAVAFTTFPSLLVRCGRWHSAAFPSCGCDACGEDAADQAERLDALVDRVVAGLFAEELRIPFFGDARLSARFGDGTPREGMNGESWAMLPRAYARRLAGRGRHAVWWQPWPRRV
jgi:hypothetical protein